MLFDVCKDLRSPQCKLKVSICPLLPCSLFFLVLKLKYTFRFLGTDMIATGGVFLVHISATKVCHGAHFRQCWVGAWPYVTWYGVVSVCFVCCVFFHWFWFFFLTMDVVLFSFGRCFVRLFCCSRLDSFSLRGIWLLFCSPMLL